MEISFKNKLLNPTEIRAINTEILLFENQKRPSVGVMKSEKKMLESVLDFVASKGQKGTVLALLKLSPELIQTVPGSFKGHIESGNLINIENYTLCFPQLRDSAGEFAKIAMKKSRQNPESIDRKRIVLALGNLLRC